MNDPRDDLDDELATYYAGFSNDNDPLHFLGPALARFRLRIEGVEKIERKHAERSREIFAALRAAVRQTVEDLEALGAEIGGGVN